MFTSSLVHGRVMRHRVPVLLSISSLVSLVLASTASALGRPATVTVRVEGLAETLLPSTQITTTAAPVIKDGRAEDACSGTSALGALDDAVAGNWSGPWESSFNQYSIFSIKGESHEFEASASANYYWSFWLNNREATVGACEAELGAEDQVLFFPACYGSGCPVSPTPLDLQSPETANRNEAVQVTVRRYDSQGQPTPLAGATVSTPGVNLRTDSSGQATIHLTQTGVITLVALAPDSVRAERRICVHDGNDGNCGTTAMQTNSSSGGQNTVQAPYVGPFAIVPKVSSITEGHHYAREGPRELTGTVSSGSTIEQLQLRLTRRTGARCSYYNSITARFHAMRCGAAHGKYFTIPPRTSFSYLLPARLRRGRYVLDVHATDAAGNQTRLLRGSTRTVFYVR